MIGLGKMTGGAFGALTAMVLGLASFGSVAPSAAADLTTKAPVVVKAPVDPWSPWQIRVRALAVLPNDGGSVDQVAGSGLKYSDSIVPELDISYYFTPNWSVELILGVTPHNIYGTGALDGLNVARVWLLPPTLTAQYHFTNFGAFQPYVGAGVNYTVFFDQSAKDVNDIDVKNTFGWALQAGFDYMIDRHWGWNVDVKKLFLQPDFDVNVGGAALTGKAKLDPWLIATGITYRF